MRELNYCPFCGGHRLDNLQGDYVHCIDCGAQGPCPNWSEDPVDAWNHRCQWDEQASACTCGDTFVAVTGAHDAGCPVVRGKP